MSQIILPMLSSKNSRNHPYSRNWLNPLPSKYVWAKMARFGSKDWMQF